MDDATFLESLGSLLVQWNNHKFCATVALAWLRSGAVAPPGWALSGLGTARIFGVACEDTSRGDVQERFHRLRRCSVPCCCRVSGTLALHGEVQTTSSTRNARLKMENELILGA